MLFSPNGFPNLFHHRHAFGIEDRVSGNHVGGHGHIDGHRNFCRRHLLEVVHIFFCRMTRTFRELAVQRLSKEPSIH